MKTEHNVTLTKGFYLGKYEVTQAQYEAVMTGNTDSLSATPSTRTMAMQIDRWKRYRGMIFRFS